MQTIVENITTGEQDFLPNIEGSEFATLFMNPPEYPSCTVVPPNPQPGDTVSLEVLDLWPNQSVKAFMGDTAIATGETDDTGQATIEFEIPIDTRQDTRLITVGVVGTAVTADCSVSVGIPTPPVQEPDIQITPPTASTVDVTTG